MSSTSTIVYTQTDEAPALATHSFCPSWPSRPEPASISELKDISLAGRILSHFPMSLNRINAFPTRSLGIGRIGHRPEANIIKLPNASASVPQLRDAIKELQDKGFQVPDFPTDPQTEQEKAVRATYAKSWDPP